MKIGIDIDGVLTNIEMFHLDYGIKFSLENNLENEKINPNGYEIEEIINCDKKYHSKFWKKYVCEYIKPKYTRIFCSEIINKLKKTGDEIHIITARKSIEEKDTKQWFKENNIYYDNMVFDVDKLQYCIENKIDLMIEDNVKNINNISKFIPVICFDTRYNIECKGKNIIRCYSWYDIFSNIIKIKE